MSHSQSVKFFLQPEMRQRHTLMRPAPALALPTAVDYLGMVVAAQEEQLLGDIAYAAAYGVGGPG